MKCKLNLVWFLAHFEPPVKGFSYYLMLEKIPCSDTTDTQETSYNLASLSWGRKMKVRTGHGH